jgi:hypothetical protein
MLDCPCLNDFDYGLFRLPDLEIQLTADVNGRQWHAYFIYAPDPISGICRGPLLVYSGIRWYIQGSVTGIFRDPCKSKTFLHDLQDR